MVAENCPARTKEVSSFVEGKVSLEESTLSLSEILGRESSCLRIA